MDVGEHCEYRDCGRQTFTPFLCEDCQHVYCVNHANSEQHNCSNPKQNDDNKNKPSSSSSLDETTQLLSISTLDLIKCGYAKCNKTSHSDIFIECRKCHRSYCPSHRHFDDHNCENIKFTAKEIAFQNGYWQCNKCSFINAPKTPHCMVCDLHQQDIMDKQAKIDDICPYCKKSIKSTAYYIHLKRCDREYRARKHEIICPHCKTAIDEYKFDIHLKKCAKKEHESDNDQNIQHKMDMDVDDDDEEVKQICPKCKDYISYKVFEMHSTFCDGIKRRTPKKANMKHKVTKKKGNIGPEDFGEFCPNCKLLIANAVYEEHLRECYQPTNTETVTPQNKNIDSGECPICFCQISKNLQFHVENCAINTYDDIEEVSSPNEEDNDTEMNTKHTPFTKKTPKKTPFFGILSDKLPSRNRERLNNVGRGTKNGGKLRTFASRRSQTGIPRQKHLYRKKETSLKMKYKSKFNNDDLSDPFDVEPPTKKRRIDDTLRSDSDLDDDHKSDDYKTYKPNYGPLIKPYFKETKKYLKDLKTNSNEMQVDKDEEEEQEEDIYCYWYFPAQHNHNEMVFKITSKEFKIAKSEHKDLNDKLMDFQLRYNYSKWLDRFKKKVYVFSSRFYEDELSEIDVKGKGKKTTQEPVITYFDEFLFDKDFLVIPKWNEICWQFLIICYHNLISNPRSGRKPCIIFWDVSKRKNKNKGKAITSKKIRKWLDLQYKHLNPNESDEEIFTSNRMKSYYSVQIPTVMDETYHNESGCYQLLNFQKFGTMAGYQNTSNKSKLNNQNWFGHKQAQKYRKQICNIIDALHKLIP